MVASDGILLASDTLCVQPSFSINQQCQCRRKKIIVDGGSAYCAAGDELASAVVPEYSER